jgi:hypothetical protein
MNVSESVVKSLSAGYACSYTVEVASTYLIDAFGVGNVIGRLWDGSYQRAYSFSIHKTGRCGIVS